MAAALGAHGQERGVETSLEGGIQVVYRPPALDPDAQGGDAVDLSRHHVSGEAVGRDSVAHHAAGER